MKQIMRSLLVVLCLFQLNNSIAQVDSLSFQEDSLFCWQNRVHKISQGELIVFPNEPRLSCKAELLLISKQRAFMEFDSVVTERVRFLFWAQEQKHFNGYISWDHRSRRFERTYGYLHPKHPELNPRIYETVRPAWQLTWLGWVCLITIAMACFIIITKVTIKDSAVAEVKRILIVLMLLSGAWLVVAIVHDLPYGSVDVIAEMVFWIGGVWFGCILLVQRSQTTKVMKRE